MAKIGPKLTEWWPVFQSVLHSLPQLWAVLSLSLSSALLKSATYEVKYLQGTDFRKFYKKQSYPLENYELTQIFIKIQQSVQKFYFIRLSRIAHFMK